MIFHNRSCVLDCFSAFLNWEGIDIFPEGNVRNPIIFIEVWQRTNGFLWRIGNDYTEVFRCSLDLICIASLSWYNMLIRQNVTLIRMEEHQERLRLNIKVSTFVSNVLDANPFDHKNSLQVWIIKWAFFQNISIYYTDIKLKPTENIKGVYCKIVHDCTKNNVIKCFSRGFATSFSMQFYSPQPALTQVESKLAYEDPVLDKCWWFRNH